MRIFVGQIKVQNNDIRIFFEQNIEFIYRLWRQKKDGFIMQFINLSVNDDAAGDVVKEENAAVIAHAEISLQPESDPVCSCVPDKRV